MRVVPHGVEMEADRLLSLPVARARQAFVDRGARAMLIEDAEIRAAALDFNARLASEVRSLWSGRREGL